MSVTSPSEERFVDVNGVTICHQTFGIREAPAVLLIMGLGAHMIQWDDEFCADLAGRGLFVIRFDNRDVGRSSPTPSYYTLADMAADSLALLDALAIAKATIVGASMGGAIAQEIALRHPQRVRALVSIMSTPGEPDLPPPGPEFAAIFFKPPPMTQADYIAANVEAWRLMRPFDDAEESARDLTRAHSAARRAPLNPEGGARQMMAMMTSGGRRARLKGLTVPTLVIHGADDPLLPLPHGEDTARAIPGARLLIIARMGHALPKATWPAVIDAIAELAKR